MTWWQLLVVGWILLNVLFVLLLNRRAAQPDDEPFDLVGDDPMTIEPMTEREKAWARYPGDAANIEPRSSTSPNTKCRQQFCRADVWWGRTTKGRLTCFDIKPDGERTGTNHWRTCRNRPERPKA
jgi:hypothetical protein